MASKAGSRGTYPTNQLVLIEWVDAAHFEAGWRDGLEVEDKEVIVWSVGWLMRESDSTLYIAQSHALDNVANLLQIPKVTLRKVQVLKYR